MSQLPTGHQARPENTGGSQMQGTYTGHKKNLLPMRAHEENLKIQVSIHSNDTEFSGSVLDLNPEGVQVLSEVVLGSGTPLALQFAFGDVCYLNISAQVVFCLASQTPGKHAMGIKFSAIREWERTILVSSIQELKESTAIQKKSLLNILVCKDTFALEVADFRIGQFSHEKPTDRKSRGGISKADLMPKQKKIDYTAEAAQARREWLSQKTGAELKHIAAFSEDPDNMRGKVENLIGVAQVPIGVAGPLSVNGQYAQGKYYVPMATTEGALVYTINQGMLIVSLAGGVTTTLLKDELHVSPIFSFKSVKITQQFVRWLDVNFERIKQVAEETTRYGKLLRLEPHIFDRHVAVKFCYSTGDAMGINMITFATEEACKLIVSTVAPQKYYLQSNFSAIKKVSAHNFISGFGKTVVSEAIVPGSLIKRAFGISPEEVVTYYQLVKLSASHSGMIGITGHTANALEAIFIACGQDVACVVDSHVGVTNFEVTEDNSLYVSVRLGSLLVGTVGGGTDLGTQRECLSLIDCYGEGQSKKFSEIVAATVLAGEIGICAKAANGTFANAHRKYGRKGWLKPFIPTNILAS
jgi:hydroxymethylglutaryl-CoA reductase (NADPH)